MKFPLAHPDLAKYRDYFQDAAPPEFDELRVTFLGVSTLLLDDGQTAIMTDGFFTRPGKFSVLCGKIAPDRQIIADSLRRAKVTKLAAVICAHSHYDHALDSPIVAELTGATLVGSESTANIGRGLELAADQILVATPGTPMSFGDFTVTLIESIHSPKARYPGTITEPLVPPGKASAWAMAQCYSIVIKHRDRTVLLQASANYVSNALDGVSADVVYLGTGTLGKQTPEFRDDYWREVVTAVSPSRVIPVHWDDFFLPLNQPLKPMPYIADDFDAAMRFVIESGRRDGIAVTLPVAWQPTNPFS